MWWSSVGSILQLRGAIQGTFTGNLIENYSSELTKLYCINKVSLALKETA